MTTIPHHWSMAEAVTILSAYSTLWYCLIKRANIKRGESILIHSAAEAVGQSAINMCLHYGCDIYVTVGTEEKKDFLTKEYNIPVNRIFNSRDTLFKNHIMDVTNGKGVDIVINSLSGDKLGASIDCLAKNGRIIDVEKYDRLGKRNANYVVKHNMQLIMAHSNEDFEFLNEFYDWMHKNCTNGCVKPINYTVFNASEAEKAFRFMTTVSELSLFNPRVQLSPITGRSCLWAQSANAEKLAVNVGII
ncbi:unnamed protein product [Oppiella nova]|uniref:Enoyl reductase (ER) domain-containing protein n=1 Tax=Oppiella nova TaxID=334625 RepID=A0A7R9QLS1_9ACAR|nr:unnamed protein product [Oppiella nova]CAG2168136.1 unnamed protein product [Oppiella nova]